MKARPILLFFVTMLFSQGLSGDRISMGGKDSAGHLSEDLETTEFVPDSLIVLAGEIKSRVFTEADFMQAFFGNYYPALGISVLEPDRGGQFDYILGDLFTLESTDLSDNSVETNSPQFSELEKIVGKVPVVLKEMYRFSSTRFVMLFTNAQIMDPMGGTHFGGVSVGLAIYDWDGLSWKCSHHSGLEGDHGVWGQAAGPSGPHPVSDDNFALGFGQYGDVYYYTILEDKPALILVATHVYATGGEWFGQQWFDSEEGFVITGGKYYDFVLETRSDDPKRYHYRRYRFNEKEKRYRMIESRGEFTEYPDLRIEDEWWEW